MAKLMYGGQNLSRAPQEKSAKTSPTTVLTGDTSVTIYDSRIKSSSFVRRYVAQFTDGTILGANTMNISDGQAVITFDSPAKEDTTVVLEIDDAEGFKEVTLWENSSPSTDMDATTVTLSDSLTNYNFIKVYYNYNTSPTDDQHYSVVMPMDTFVKGVYPIQNYMPQLQLGVYASVSNVRGVMYASPTSVRFSPANNVAQSGVSNNRCIPTKITGLTELNQVKIRNAKVENVLWTNSAPTSSFAKQDVTLSDDINSYDYLKFTYRVTTSVADSMNYIIGVSDFKKSVENASIQNCIFGLSTDDSVAHTRRVYYKNDTTVNFNNAYQLNAVASNNATVIPLSVIGIKEVSTHKADIYGAAQDTIYYSTNGTDWTVVGQTDSNGYLANAVLPDTAFILKSSVAKNPEDLTADYTKAFNTDSNVLKFMPDNCLYWYGNLCTEFTGGIDKSVWISRSGISREDLVLSTNHIAMGSGSTSTSAGGNDMAYYYKNNIPIGSYSKAHIVVNKVQNRTATDGVDFVTASGKYIGGYDVVYYDGYPASSPMTEVSTMIKYDITITHSEATDLVVGFNHYNSRNYIDMYALWLE